MTARPLFELTHVNKTFPVETDNVVILKDVNVIIHQGEFVCVFGPSGCGKTTLLNIMTGLEPPSSGEIRYLDFDLTAATEDQFTEFRKNNIGMLYQQQHWVHSLNVVDNVAFALHLRGVDPVNARERAMAKLREVGMEKWALYRPNRLSAGQQQRVGLARALMSDPSIIIADEPTGNLDQKNGETLMDQLQALHKQGKTIIMVTHNLEHLAYVSKIIHILDGQVVQTFGTTGMTLDQIKDQLASAKATPLLSLPVSKTAAIPPHYGVALKHNFIKRFFLSFKGIGQYLSLCASFVILIATYWFNNLMHYLGRLSFIPHSLTTPFRALWRRIYQAVTDRFDRGKLPTVKRSYLIDLSLRSLRVKFVRSFITIGGMAIGIGAIVFLVSIGYGLERLVLQRVTKLNEIEQIEVTTTVNEQNQLDQKSLKSIRGIENVQHVYPLIDIAGRVSFQESKTDVVVFGAQSDYFQSSSIPVVAGAIYKNNEINPVPASMTDEEIAAAPRNSDGSISVTLPTDQTRTTVINDTFAKILGVSNKEIINEKMQVSFVVTGPLVNNKYKIASNVVEYTITGVVSDGDSPYMYVPINDVQSLGIANFSQFTVDVNNQDNVDIARQKVEAMGFQTTSVLDTINQIESLFRTVRVVLLLIGTAALLVAAFGMFNTLTVSLLERTKEIGLMKSLGMKSAEVKELFLTESMQMGLMGGMFGLLLGFLCGQLLSLVLSIFSLANGQGFLGVTTIPWYFSIAIVLFSVLVGITTGVYPSRRAAKISALQALLNE